MIKTRLLSILATGIFCVAIFTQCGEVKKGAENAADKTKEMAGDAADATKKMAGDAADATKKMADKTVEAGKDAVNAIDSKVGDLSFEAGSWADKLVKGMTSGSSTNFTLDQVPYEGEEISAAGKEQLDNLASILKENEGWAAEIQGHTTGTQKVGNGGMRAKWVQAKLMARGVKNKQLSSKGYGADNLLSGLPEDDDKHKRITVELSK